MARIFPFRAYRYSQKLDPASVLTQPYDKITPEMQQRYAVASPYNLIAVEKGLTRPEDSAADNIYTRAAQSLQQWIADKIIVADPEPSLYAYSQTYVLPPGSNDPGVSRETRTGLIALGQIEDYSAGVVFRHEQTLSGPKADRLELLRHTHAHTGQLFMIYSDASKRVDAILAQTTAAKPDTQLTDEYGVEHRLYRIAQPGRIAEIQTALAAQKLVIADGHHRYETALAYRNEQRAAHAGSPDPHAPYERVMMTLINTHGTPVTILPTHRVVSNLENFDFQQLTNRLDAYFDSYDVRLPAGAAFDSALHAALAASAHSSVPTIGAYTGGATLTFFTLKENADLAEALPDASPLQRQLDVVLLHGVILERGLGITAEAVRQEKNLHYERNASAAVDAVRQGRAQIAFLLNPTPLESVIEIATSGEVMPQKSTDFYPKLLSGITIYRLED